jgi:GTP1/Obg family GTP-binding protein
MGTTSSTEVLANIPQDTFKILIAGSLNLGKSSLKKEASYMSETSLAPLAYVVCVGVFRSVHVNTRQSAAA